MKLLWSSRSPFVRKVMIVVHELGLDAHIECVRVVVNSVDRNAQVTRSNPVGKIPTLILDDGSALYDSRVIVEYLGWRHGNETLFPTGQARWNALRHQALADGIMEADIRWIDERNRPLEMQLPARLEACRERIAAGLDALDSEAAFINARTPTVGHFSVASALAHLDFRFEELAWRDGRARLAGWFETINARPSMRATRFADDF